MRTFDEWNYQSHTDQEDGRKYNIYSAFEQRLMSYGWSACLKELTTLSVEEFKTLQKSMKIAEEGENRQREKMKAREVRIKDPNNRNTLHKIPKIILKEKGSS